MRSIRVVSILVLALVACAFASTARASSRPHFGLEGTANVGQLGSDTFFGNGRYWQWGGGLAMLSEWSVAPSWAIEVAPGWERQVRRATWDVRVTGSTFVGTFPIDQSFHFDRLVLPVRASWKPAGGRWSFEGGGGPAWLARAERRNESEAIYASPTLASGAAGRPVTPDAAIFEEVGTFNRTDMTRSFNRWDAVVSGGLGWDQPAGVATLRMRARWQQGLVDFAKYGAPVRFSSGSLSLGLLW